MERRVVPRGARPSSPYSAYPSAYPSPPHSADRSMRTMEVLPPEGPVRPASPSYSSLPSPHSRSSVGSPGTSRRRGDAGTFLTALRGNHQATVNGNEQNGALRSSQDSISNYDGSDTRSEFTDTLSEYTFDMRSDIDTRSDVGDADGDDEQRSVEEELARVEAEQIIRRAELDLYMNDLHQKQDVVEFPSNFTELLDTIEADQLATSSFWARYMVDKNIDNPWMEDEQLAKGLERIRKLDIILARKTKQAREVRKAMQANQPNQEGTNKSKKGKKIGPRAAATHHDRRATVGDTSSGRRFNSHSF